MCDHCKHELNYKGYCKRCGEEICEACSSLTNPRIHQECLNKDITGIIEIKEVSPYISRPFGTEMMSAIIPRPYGTPLDIFLGDYYNSIFFKSVILPSIMYDFEKSIDDKLRSMKSRNLIMPAPDEGDIEIKSQFRNPFDKTSIAALREYRNNLNLSRYK